MKNRKNQEMIIDNNLTLLSNEQLQGTNGGIIAAILAAATIYAGVCAVAYGAGALYGIITK
jgi:hypothetical protein